MRIANWAFLLPLALALSFANASQARTLAEIKARGILSQCANPDALPFSSEKGELRGFQLELGALIAKELGVSFQPEWIKPRYRANLVNCDLLVDSINDAAVHEGKLLLSRPYHRTGVALGVGPGGEQIKSFADLQPGQKIGVMINSVASVVLGKRGVTTSPYAYEQDMVEDLETGALFGAAISAAKMGYYVMRNPAKGIRVIHAYDAEPELRWEVSVGMRKADQALADAVDAALGKLLADGSIARIYAKYGVEHRVPEGTQGDRIKKDD